MREADRHRERGRQGEGERERDRSRRKRGKTSQSDGTKMRGQAGRHWPEIKRLGRQTGMATTIIKQIYLPSTTTTTIGIGGCCKLE